MTNKTEKKVAKSFNNVKPDVYANVEASCPQRSGAAVKRNNVFRWKIATCALAVLFIAVVVLGGVGFGIRANDPANAEIATVTLDVNPSVSIKINGEKRVADVTPLNADGELILGTMDLKGVQLEVAVNAIIGSMMRKGYLSNLSNSVLVSVDAEQSYYDDLVALVTQEIQLKLKENEIEASVVSQWMRDSDEASRLAAELNISVGKATLITKILNNSPEGRYTAEQLSKLTVNDLNLILEELNIPGDELTQNGSASEAKYIGREAAIAAALEAVEGSPSEADVQQLKCKMDNDYGVMLYEVEFVYDGWEYEIDVDAVSGGIVKLEREKEHHTPDPSKKVLSEQEIRDLVYDMLNIPVEEREWFQLAYYPEDREYEAKINDNKGTFYTIELDVYGNVLSYKEEEIEVMPSPDGNWNTQGAPGDDYNAMMQYLLQQLKGKYGEISFEDILTWEVDIDRENNRDVYEIEFKWRDANGRVYEFECELDYNTRELLRCTRELDD